MKMLIDLHIDISDMNGSLKQPEMNFVFFGDE
jgi:hypothetical protein